MSVTKQIVTELDPNEPESRLRRIEFMLAESGISDFKQNGWKLYALIEEQKQVMSDLLQQVNVLSHEKLQDRKEIELLRMQVKALHQIVFDRRENNSK